MAKHEFGIMNKAPSAGKRYDAYDPNKYNCIPVDDDYMEAVAAELQNLHCYWHSLDVPQKGLAYCGITLIPSESLESFISVIENHDGFEPLKQLAQKALDEGKYIIHYGL